MPREEFTEEVIILKIGQLREIDCWVRFLTPSRGILTAFAFGGYRSRRRFPGCLDILNQVMFKVVSNRTGKYLYLQEGTLLQRFPGITRSLNRLGMAINCLKFIEAAHLGEDDSRAAFYLVLQALQILDSDVFVPASFPLLFRTRITVEYGYYPDLRRCSICGKEVEADCSSFFFVLREGRVSCGDCLQRSSFTGIELGTDALLGLESIFSGFPSSWVDESVYAKLDKRTMQLMDRFVQYHMGLVWESGHFRHV
ncbi:MAG: DNA repair protein RecO [Thermodesulfobacteriota bacterium]